MSTMADSPPIAEATVRVDCGAPQGPMRRIWTSFGFDEINWTSMPAGKRHLRTIGAFAEQPYYVRSHYIFNSGIGWSLPHWGAGNVYHEDAAGRPVYDFSIADQVYDAVIHAGHRPLVELAFTPRALVPDDAEAAVRVRAEPDPVEPLRGRAVGDAAQGLRQVGRSRARARRALRGALRGASPCAGWLWELWNEPDIYYWRGTAEQFHALYDVTAAAVKAALPEAAVGGPATTGDLGPGRRGHEFLRGFLAHCAQRGTPLDFVSFHTKGARYTPWRVYGPLGGPAPTRQSPSSLKMLREVHAALGAVAAHPRFRDLPCIVDECDASVPAHWGVFDNANFGYRNTEYFAVFQCKLMKKLLDLDARTAARVHQATTWSFYFEGERFFEGTRSLFTAQGIEKPVLNAYRMLGRLGDTRLADRVEPGVAARSARRRRGGDAGGGRRAGDVPERGGRADPRVAPRRRPVRDRRPRDRRHAAHRAGAVRRATSACTTRASTRATATATRCGRRSAGPRIRRRPSCGPSRSGRGSSASDPTGSSRSGTAS